MELNVLLAEPTIYVVEVNFSGKISDNYLLDFKIVDTEVKKVRPKNQNVDFVCTTNYLCN